MTNWRTNWEQDEKYLQKENKMKKTTKTIFEYIGKDERLEGEKLKDFIKFMLLRFPNEQHTSYIREWATRFRNDSEWFYADSKSMKILLKINPKKYNKYKK
jgi:uncharacterized protein YchJ